MLLIRKLFVCWWGACGMIQRNDDIAIWGECPRCHKIAGYLTRDAIRAYMKRHHPPDGAEY